MISVASLVLLILGVGVGFLYVFFVVQHLITNDPILLKAAIISGVISVACLIAFLVRWFGGA